MPETFDDTPETPPPADGATEPPASPPRPERSCEPRRFDAEAVVEGTYSSLAMAWCHLRLTADPDTVPVLASMVRVAPDRVAILLTIDSANLLSFVEGLADGPGQLQAAISEAMDRLGIGSTPPLRLVEDLDAQMFPDPTEPAHDRD